VFAKIFLELQVIMKKYIFVACIGLFPALSSFAEDPANYLFAVVDPGRAFPIAIVQGTKFNDLRLSIVAPKGAGVDFVDANLLHQAQELYLYHDGGLLQHSAVDGVHIEAEAGCTSGEYVEFDAKQSKATLATTNPAVMAQAAHSTLPDKVERQTSLRLAASLFRSKNLPIAVRKALLAAMKINALQVRDGDRKLLTFTSKVAKKDKVYVLLALAENSDKNAYKINYVEFYAGEDNSTAPGGSEYFDHLDLDGDGLTEIVYSYSGYEWWGFEVIKKIGLRWQLVHRQFVGGC